MNEPISMQIGINLPRGNSMNGQEFKGQGHRRPKLCLEAWRKHHFRISILESSVEARGERRKCCLWRGGYI